MKIKVFEEGMNNPTDRPDTQQKVVEFNGSFEEYKALEIQTLKKPMKGIEIMKVRESEDGNLVVDYIAIRMNRKWIRQTHSLAQE